MNDVPKGNCAQIVLAVCAILTLLITVFSYCDTPNSTNTPKVNTTETKPIVSNKTTPKNNTNDELEALLDEVKKNNSRIKPSEIDKCAEEILKQDHKLLPQCLRGLIQSKKFDDAIAILEKAKTQTINKSKIWFFNTKLNDISIIQMHDLDDAAGEYLTDYVLTRKGEKHGLTDKKGEIIYPTIFDEIDPHFLPLIYVKEHGKVGFLDSKAKVVHPPKFDSANPQDFRPLVEIEVNGLYGFLDSLGNVVQKPKFDKLNYPREGMISVSKEGKWGFINNSNGKLVIDTKYSKVEQFDKGKSKVRLYDKEFFIDKKGNKIK